MVAKTTKDIVANKSNRCLLQQGKNQLHIRHH
jgi:hypothetical protein